MKKLLALLVLIVVVAGGVYYSRMDKAQVAQSAAVTETAPAEETAPAAEETAAPAEESAPAAPATEAAAQEGWKVSLPDKGIEFTIIPDDNAAAAAVADQLKEGAVKIHFVAVADAERAGRLPAKVAEVERKESFAKGDVALWHGSHLVVVLGDSTRSMQPIGKVAADDLAQLDKMSESKIFDGTIEKAN